MGDARVSTDIHIGWHIKHDSDDSYFGFTDNDTIIFATSNAERVRINSSGNVGIGTQPQCKLDVKSTDTLSDEILLNLKTEANSGKSYTFKTRKRNRIWRFNKRIYSSRRRFRIRIFYIKWQQ